MRTLELGRPAASLGRGYPPPADIPTWGQIVSSVSPPFTTHPYVQGSDNAGRASSTWQSINDPLAFPFMLNRNETVYRLGWFNGSAAGGNADVGIYDSAFARIVSTGSTAAVTNSVPQFVDITDTVLTAGTLYYLAYVRDDVTSNRIARVAGSTSAPALGICGVQTTTTDSFPLPNPLAGMGVVTATFTIIPLCFMAFRDTPL